MQLWSVSPVHVREALVVVLADGGLVAQGARVEQGHGVGLLVGDLVEARRVDLVWRWSRKQFF